MKMGQGKGNKKNLTEFDSITIVDNPAPPGRVKILMERYEKGLDLFTGEPLHKPILVEVKGETEIEYDDIDCFLPDTD